MSHYNDIAATLQVIGNIYKKPSLLDNEKYFFTIEDFTEEFHKILFRSVHNLYKLGAKEINENVIQDYLKDRPEQLATFKTSKGTEYLQKISDTIQLSTFDYHYQKMKKMTLLRMYDSIGMDLTWLYDPDNVLDIKKKQAQEDWLDNTPLETIADEIDKRITDIRLKYVDDANSDFNQAGHNVEQLIEHLQNHPEIGVPLYGNLVNTITRGARLKKFYLRSAATGVGKTRSMIADACNIACNRIWNSKTKTWDENGTQESTLFITTEQELDEIQTMMLAFLSDVDEHHIIYNEYSPGELNRVQEAAKILMNSPLYIKKLPDFSLKDIENAIKYSVMEWKVQYVFHDYVHSSMKILSEITSKAGVKGLREDNVLFMISVRLKDLCNEYGIFIMSATQLNASYQDAEILDQNLLRGAKSIADKIDLGMIMVQTTDEDKESLKTIISKGGFPIPTVKMSIYKNRRGQYKDVLLWCTDRRATCRITPIFATTYDYQLIDMPELKITVQEKEI